jgi:hypothetical protein
MELSESSYSYITLPRKNPYSPLLKNPFIKIKLEAKNLDKAIINVNNLNINDFKKGKNLNHNINLEPYAVVTMGVQKFTLEKISSNNPVWEKELKFEIKDKELESVSILFHTKSVTGYNLNNNSVDQFIAFQLIPISYFEKYSGKPESIWFKLITTKPDEYLNQKHDPEIYKRTATQADKESNINYYK